MVPHNLAMLDMLGFPLLLIRSGESKAPAQKGWPTIELDDETVAAVMASDPEQGYGVKLGGSTSLIDIEGDGPAAEVSWEILTDGIPIPETCSWKSDRGLHRLFRIDDQIRSVVGEGIVKAGDLEIRLGSADQYTHYSVVPPMTGRAWVNDPEDYDVALLPVELAGRIKALHADKRPEYDEDYVNPQPDAPGSIYDEQGDWDDILTADGWTTLGSRSEGVSDWCRPGKSSGLSATTGFCGDRLYVFTTGVEHLESGASYSKFQYLTETKFDSDYTVSAKWLASQGFTRPSSSVFDDISSGSGLEDGSEDTVDVVAASLDVSTELLLFPGFVADFARLHAKRSPRVDPRAGAVMGILFQAWLMSRRVMLEDGTRPNIALMMLGQAGCGKTSAVETLDSLLQQLGSYDSLNTSFKSSQGLQDSISDTPSMMFIQEEAQDFLAAISSQRGSSYMTEMSGTMKDILTKSKGTYRPRVGAKGGEKGTPVDQPHLSIMFTGLPEIVWDAMDEKLMRDGFVSRFCPIELGVLPERNPHPHVDVALFSNCMAHCKGWHSVKPGEEEPPDNGGEVSTGRIIPLIIPEDPSSYDMSLDFAMECDDKLRKLGGSNAAEASIWVRAHEMLCKFQLLIAGSAAAVGCRITVGTTERALGIVRAVIALKIYRMSNRHSDHPNGALHVRVIGMLERYADRGNRRVDWRKAYRNLNMRPLDFNSVVCELRESGLIHTDATITPDGARVLTKGRFICLRKYAGKKFDSVPPS